MIGIRVSFRLKPPTATHGPFGGRRLRIGGLRLPGRVALIPERVLQRRWQTTSPSSRRPINPSWVPVLQSYWPTASQLPGE